MQHEYILVASYVIKKQYRNRKMIKTSDFVTGSSLPYTGANPYPFPIVLTSIMKKLESVQNKTQPCKHISIIISANLEKIAHFDQTNYLLIITEV